MGGQGGKGRTASCTILILFNPLITITLSPIFMPPTTWPPVTSLIIVILLIPLFVLLLLVVAPSIVGINCMEVVKPEAGTVLLRTWYCRTPINMLASLATFWFAGSAMNFANAWLEGARRVIPWAEASMEVSWGWVASNAGELLVEGKSKGMGN